jgi:alpha-glucosidase
MHKTTSIGTILCGLALAIGLNETAPAQTNAQAPPHPERQRTEPRTRSRRSERVKMPEVQVTSPNGRVKLTILPDAGQLTFKVTLDDTTVIEPSPIVMDLDGYDLSSGVVFSNQYKYAVSQTYPWYGAHSTATNRCNGVRILLQHDLSTIEYTLDVRAFDDGVAFRHIIPGAPGVSRVPDEYSTFIIPAGSTVWYGGMEGHYESDYVEKDISAMQPGEWAGPPMTFKLPGNAGYGSITEADLVDYAGMALEADGRRGWVVGLGHRQPLSWPFELRYGREAARLLGKPAAITGPITTPWRVVMIGHDLNTLVNSTIVPDLCPPPDPHYFPRGIKTDWIKPGRAVWRYVDGGPNGVDGMKEFSRLAGELG